MKLPSKTFIFGALFGIVALGVVYFGYNFGTRVNALTVAWKYPEVVRNLQVEEVLQATISGQSK